MPYSTGRTQRSSSTLPHAETAHAREPRSLSHSLAKVAYEQPAKKSGDVIEVPSPLRLFAPAARSGDSGSS